MRRSPRAVAALTLTAVGLVVCAACQWIGGVEERAYYYTDPDASDAAAPPVIEASVPIDPCTHAVLPPPPTGALEAAEMIVQYCQV